MGTSLGMLLHSLALAWLFLQTGQPAVVASSVHGGLLLENRQSTPAPVVISPSQFFEGIDGPWSTFELRVGNPPQNVRFLPGSSSTTTLVVLPQGCTNDSCYDSRGGVFNSSGSSTWDEIGIFGLGFEDTLGFDDNGLFGRDSVGLGYLGSGGPTVNHSIIGGVAGTEFYLAVLGLNPRPTNFTTQNDPQPSLMQLLKNQSHIPSLSYSYTAGAPYRLNKALGTLILGGYDASQFQDTNSSYHFFSDQSRDLTIGLEAITSNITGKKPDLLPSGRISTFVDSSVAGIWLPLDACEAFEKAFGLQYDQDTELYLVNKTLHQSLSDKNPSVTFTLTTAISGGSSFDVDFPYASFDLQAESPLVENSTRYFPLHRAANDTQYTLGRTFLQEAYLIVDYERGNFSIHSRTWDAGAKSNIVSILSPADAPSPNPTPVVIHNSEKLGTGAIAGIAVGAVLVIAFSVIVLLWFLLVIPRRKRKAAATAAIAVQAQNTDKDLTKLGPGDALDPNKSTTDETEGTVIPELETPGVNGPMSEFEGSSPLPNASEMGTPYSPPRIELPSPPAELHNTEVYEMPGSDVPELHGGSPASEPARGDAIGTSESSRTRGIP